MKRTPIRAKRRTPRKRDAPRWTAAEWDEANAYLYRRCGYRCDRCGEPLRAVERHHRLRREQGGDRLANILMVHPECHFYITTNPKEAYANGWSVHAETDPALVPVRIGGHWWVLDDEGSQTPVP